jgi:hypothetical protein
MWQWLELHGAALQAAGSVIGALVGCVTIPVLVMAYFAARQAACAATEQALAARAQTEVSRAQQLAAERAAAAAEAQVASAETSGAIARQQLLAAQESAAADRIHSKLVRQQTLASLRPVLMFVRRFSSHISWTVLENQSEALALDVAAFNGHPDSPGKPITVSPGILAAGAEARLEGIDSGTPETNIYGEVVKSSPIPVFVKYRSQDGRWFRTIVKDLRNQEHTQCVEEEA